MKFASFFGHLGILFGFLALIVMLYPFYLRLDPSGGNPSGVLLFPVLFWSIGLLFVLGEYYELKHPD